MNFDPATIAGAAALAASSSWAISTVLMKGAIDRCGPRAMNLFRLMIALTLFWTATLIVDGGAAAHAFATHDGWLLLGSGVIGLALGDVLLFEAMYRLGAQPAVALNQLSPIWSALLGFALGSEALVGREFLGIALVLGGVLLVIFGRHAPRVAPSRDLGGGVGAAADTAAADTAAADTAAVANAAATHAAARRVQLVGMLCGLGSSCCNAFAGMITHQAIGSVGVLPGSTLRMTGGAVALLLATLAMRRGPTDLAPLRALRLHRRELLSVLIGTCGGVFLQQQAYSGLDASIALCLLSTTPLFLLPMAVALLGERYRWWVWLGTLLATAGVPLLLVGNDS
ncbi:MAG: DMT family transporter [Planctomycetes bacterium]|nr:DMT family transporter [Planctomycetota bacterium]